MISIIVPVYNVEKYLEKCLISLTNQTYKNIEIIIVDDCSTDKSLDIVKYFMDKDSRIKILRNNENKGVAYSRNKALEIAQGNYIAFLDSDDYVSYNFYEKLLLKMKKENSDLGVVDIKVISAENEKVERCFVQNLSKENIINTGLAASPCNKLFDRKLILDKPFPEGKINEDVAVVIPAIIKAKNIVYVNDVYYYYVQRCDSIQNSEINENRLDIFDTLGIALEKIKEEKNYLKYKEMIVFWQLINFYLSIIPQEKNSKKRLSYIKKCVKLLNEYDYKNNEYLRKYLNTKNKKELILPNLLLSGSPYVSNSAVNLYNLYKKIKNR